MFRTNYCSLSNGCVAMSLKSCYVSDSNKFDMNAMSWDDYYKEKKTKTRSLFFQCFACQHTCFMAPNRNQCQVIFSVDIFDIFHGNFFFSFPFIFKLTQLCILVKSICSVGVTLKLPSLLSWMQFCVYGVSNNEIMGTNALK